MMAALVSAFNSFVRSDVTMMDSLMRTLPAFRYSTLENALNESNRSATVLTLSHTALLVALFVFTSERRLVIVLRDKFPVTLCSKQDHHQGPCRADQVRQKFAAHRHQRLCQGAKKVPCSG